MKSLMTTMALVLLAGCAGMDTSGGSTDNSDMYRDFNERYNDPTSPHYFGQG